MKITELKRTMSVPFTGVSSGPGGRSGLTSVILELSPTQKQGNFSYRDPQALLSTPTVPRL